MGITKKNYTFRLEIALAEELRAKAEAMGLSLNSMVTYAIKSALSTIPTIEQQTEERERKLVPPFLRPGYIAPQSGDDDGYIPPPIYYDELESQ